MGELLGGASTVDAVIGMQLCMRGDELPVGRAENPSDQLGMYSCLFVKHREISSGDAPLYSIVRVNHSLDVCYDLRHSSLIVMHFLAQ